MRTPRPYQIECKDAIRAGFRRGLKGVAAELFTGAGKGYVIADIAKSVIEKGGRALVLVNRDNLCGQLSDSLIEQGLYPQTEKGLFRASPMSNCVVGSIPTLQGKRLERWNPNHFNLVITDEAHFAASRTFKNTLDYFKSSYHLFLTATIERHDKAGLWSGVEELVYSKPLQSGIDEGWLTPYEREELPVPIQMSDKMAAKRMFTEKDESEVFSAGEYLPRLFSESAARCHDKHGLMFWPSTDASKEAAAHYNSNGVESRHIDCYMSDSEIEDVKTWFKSPGPKTCHCADYFSYGYDNPLIDCVGLMRICRSIPMTKQRIGRGTRANCVIDGLPDATARKQVIAGSVKPRFQILDLMIQLGDIENKFADATCLISEDNEEREFVRQEGRKAGTSFTMEELEGKLKAKRETDKEKQLAKLAEDAANAAEKRKSVVSNHQWYVDKVVNEMFNPNHKPAERWMYGKLNAMGANIPRETKLSGYQFFKIRDRFEGPRQKVLTGNS